MYLPLYFRLHTGMKKKVQVFSAGSDTLLRAELVYCNTPGNYVESGGTV